MVSFLVIILLSLDIISVVGFPCGNIVIIVLGVCVFSIRSSIDLCPTRFKLGLFAISSLTFVYDLLNKFTCSFFEMFNARLPPIEPVPMIL